MIGLEDPTSEQNPSYCVILRFFASEHISVAMSKITTIIIDSDDDDGFVEILEKASTTKLSVPAKEIHTKQSNEVAFQQATKRGSVNAPALSRASSIPTSSNVNIISRMRKPTSPDHSSKVAPSPKPVQTNPFQTKSIPKRPIISPKHPLHPSPTINLPQESPRRSKSMSRMISSPNLIPAPVVIYSTGGTSETIMPLDSVNKMFQRDARSVTLEKATEHASGLLKSSSLVAKSKKFEIDSELAAIFAHTHEPSFSIEKSSSQIPKPFPLRADKKPTISSSPTRPSIPNNSSEGLRRGSSLFSPNSLNSLPAPTRQRPIDSRQDASPFRRPIFDKKKIIYDIYDEDGEEENLESYINHVSSRRKLFHDGLQEEEKRQIGNKQCPLCYMMFPKQEIDNHAFNCNGKPSEKGLKKKTIGAAVARNAAERKRKNTGIQDTGPTNYYADSEGALALDGTGFGSEATGLTWESAGQIRYA
ncbi:hypothetical protein BD408DRAFT_436353 [Parasitella parasitica]|nr:hypothetical protein BD408DRAFT_436353 [Parasitella parasitica]